jgi:hypothetical protein
MHGGWYMLNGGVPYVNIWDVKPPLAFEIPAILWMFSFGEPAVMYAFSVIITGVATCGIVLLVCILVEELTGDGWAGLIAGISTFAFPFLFYYPVKGFRPKSLVFLFGLLGLVLAIRDRPFMAGAIAAASAGLWQMAAIFPLLAIGIIIRRDSSIRRLLAGEFVAMLVVTLPIVALGGGQEMLVETVLIPLTSTEGSSLGFVAIKTVFLVAAAVPVLLAGFVGIIIATKRDPADQWWLAVGGGWFIIQVTVDLDYFPDLFGLYLFAAIGTGLLASGPIRKWFRSPAPCVAVLSILAMMVVTNGVLGLAVGPASGYNPIAATEEITSSVPNISIPENKEFPDKYGPYYEVSPGEYMNDLFWKQQIPPYCHYRFSIPEKRWLQQTERTYISTCGTLPSTSVRL